jgi:spore coat protein H
LTIGGLKGVIRYMRGYSISVVAVLILVVVSQGRGVAEDFFAKDQVIGIRIVVSEEGLKGLEKAPRVNVPVEVSWEGQKGLKGMMHLKGHGSFRPITSKASFSIVLSEGKFYGHKRLLLNNSAQDGSLMKWKLASEMFLKAGVPAARINFGRVTLNERELGMYLVLEPTDKIFLKSHLGSDEGNLYEGSNNDIEDRLDVDNGSGKQEDLKRLTEACRETDLKRRWERLNGLLDMERVISFIAVEVLVCHHDGYSMDRNNFRIYDNPLNHKVSFIPHGLDLLFDQPNLPLEPQFSGIVARAIIETPAGQKAYLERVQELAHLFYGNDALIERMEKVALLLGKSVGREEVAGVRKNLKARGEFVRQELEK